MNKKKKGAWATLALAALTGLAGQTDTLASVVPPKALVGILVATNVISSLLPALTGKKDKDKE